MEKSRRRSLVMRIASKRENIKKYLKNTSQKVSQPAKDVLKKGVDGNISHSNFLCCSHASMYKFCITESMV